MDDTLKNFFSCQLTKSLLAEVTVDDHPHHEIVYKLTNTALVVKIVVNKTYVPNDDDEYFMRIFTKLTNESLKLTHDSDKDYSLYLETHNTKDIVEIINTLKTKFFQL